MDQRLGRDSAMSYKLGKLPARPGAIKLKLSSYLNLPKVPSKYGHQTLESSWQMLGNDEFGDCVWAGAAHETMLWNIEAGKRVNFSNKSVLSDYSKVTGFNPNDPSTDRGTDMQVAAAYRQKSGVLDADGNRHKVGAYVAITPGNKDEAREGLYLFGVCGIGIKFPASAMSQFKNGKPWTIVSTSPIEGGHYVPAVGYDSRYLYVVTWGKIQRMSWGFYKRYSDEAIVYLSSEFLKQGKSLEGFDLAQLNEDLRVL